jgi:hypothetical protein
MGEDEGPLYLSQEAVDRQKELLLLSNEELIGQLMDVSVQICVRQRMPPRNLFDQFLNAQEDFLERMIPVMAEALSAD